MNRFDLILPKSARGDAKTFRVIKIKDFKSGESIYSRFYRFSQFIIIPFIFILN